MIYDESVKNTSGLVRLLIALAVIGGIVAYYYAFSHGLCVLNEGEGCEEAFNKEQ